MNTTSNSTLPLYLQPPSVTLLVIVAALGVQHAFGPWPTYPHSSAAGGVLAIAGLLLMAWARFRFMRRDTTLFVGRESSSLVCDGPFRFSRNPMYVGVITVLTGLGLSLGTLPALLMAPVVFLILRLFHIPREEKMLLRRFGNAYQTYCSNVRRWL